MSPGAVLPFFNTFDDVEENRMTTSYIKAIILLPVI